MDLQRTFDTVAEHLLTQDAKALHQEEGKTPVLMLRTPAGLKDSIGCLIPAALYHPDMEGYAFKGPATWTQWSNNTGLTKLHDALERGRVYVDDETVMRLLTALQNVHDNHEPEFWFERLVAVARTFRCAPYALDVYREQRDARRRLSQQGAAP